ncbi:MAG TPA: hypothetical protein VEA69_05345 [Tepidisphaeraceae bacterium]|nr:hypothetical protein [Tepidisphaeraceae bacterium]
MLPAQPAQSAAPSTTNELIQAIATLVRDRFAATGLPSSGTWLAAQLRERYPALSYPALGLTRLGDAVKMTEAAGLLVRRHDVTHLEVLPGVASAPAEPLKPSLTSCPWPPVGKRFVRPGLWRALVFGNPRRRHFFDRNSGNVEEVDPATGVSDHGSRCDPPQYVELPQVNVDVEREWIHGFMQAKGLGDAMGHLADSPHPGKGFLFWLREKDTADGTDLEREWRSQRAAAIVDFVNRWAVANDIPTDAVFETQLRRPAPLEELQQLPGRLPKTSSLPTAPTSEAAIKHVILASIAEMPLDKILDLAIPIRYLIKHLKP